mgnify:FL=1
MFLGKLADKTGAIVSLSPPVIVPRLAQLIVNNNENKKRNRRIFFGIVLYISNHKITIIFKANEMFFSKLNKSIM